MPGKSLSIFLTYCLLLAGFPSKALSSPSPSNLETPAEQAAEISKNIFEGGKFTLDSHSLKHKENSQALRLNSTKAKDVFGQYDSDDPRAINDPGRSHAKADPPVMEDSSVSDPSPPSSANPSPAASSHIINPIPASEADALKKLPLQLLFTGAVLLGIFLPPMLMTVASEALAVQILSGVLGAVLSLPYWVYVGYNITKGVLFSAMELLTLGFFDASKELEGQDISIASYWLARVGGLLGSVAFFPTLATGALSGLSTAATMALGIGSGAVMTLETASLIRSLAEKFKGSKEEENKKEREEEPRPPSQPPPAPPSVTEADLMFSQKPKRNVARVAINAAIGRLNSASDPPTPEQEARLEANLKENIESLREMDNPYRVHIVPESLSPASNEIGEAWGTLSVDAQGQFSQSPKRPYAGDREARRKLEEEIKRRAVEFPSNGTIKSIETELRNFDKDKNGKCTLQSPCLRLHDAIDQNYTQAKAGRKLGSPCNGTVAAVDYNSSGGNALTISCGKDDSGNLKLYRFLHLGYRDKDDSDVQGSGYLLNPGDTVGQHELVALAGDTGKEAEGKGHAHWEVYTVPKGGDQEIIETNLNKMAELWKKNPGTIPVIGVDNKWDTPRNNLDTLLYNNRQPIKTIPVKNKTGQMETRTIHARVYCATYQRLKAQGLIKEQHEINK